MHSWKFGLREGNEGKSRAKVADETSSNRRVDGETTQSQPAGWNPLFSGSKAVWKDSGGDLSYERRQKPKNKASIWANF